MATIVMPTRRARWQAAWKERRAKISDAAHNIIRAFGLVWQAHPPSALGMAACTLVGAFIPVGQVWVGKLIVDGVVNALEQHLGAAAGLQAVLPFLAIEFGLFLLRAVNEQVREYAEHILHAQINLSLNGRIIRKALELDLVHFENAEYYDKLENARREADWRSLQIVNGGFYLIQNTITLVSYSALLMRFSPWLALILFGATIPAFIVQNRLSELRFRVLSWRAPESRQLNYLEYLLTNLDAVKEIKLFGLGEPLLGRYSTLFTKFLNEDRAIARKRSLASLGWGLLTTLTFYFAYACIVMG
jgi:ATP-binding cassette subfamily B protein